MTTSDQDLLNAFSDLHVKLENNLEFEAHTGIYSADGVTWITDTPGKPGFWWVRRDSDGLQIACFNDAASKPDQPVICRWDTKTGIPTIVRVHNEKSPVYNPTAVPVSVPPISTGPGSGREQYNPASLISDGLVFARSGMTVGINSFAAVYQQSQNTYAPPDTDLTSYIPGTASTHCWAMVGYDPVTNAVQVVASTPIAVSMPLTQAQLSAISFANYIPLAAVQLTNGQTTLQFPGQFVDRRPWITGQWWTMPLGVSYGGTGLATLPANLLLAGNGTNPLQSVTNGTAGQPLLATAGLPAFSALALDGGASIVSGYGATRNVLISNGSQWQSRALVAADIPNLDASKITAGQLALAQGGTHADLSATGGAHFVVMQESASANLTVRALTTADMPSGIIVSPLTAKGDLWTYSSVDAKLTVGANNTVLVADSSTTTGNKWSATLAGLTLTTPTIASFTNATHNHQNAPGGGALDVAAITTGTFANSFINWAAPGTLGSTTPNTVAATNVTITSGGYIRPSADSTSAILWTKADGTTVTGLYDSTNGQWMFGSSSVPSGIVSIKTATATNDALVLTTTDDSTTKRMIRVVSSSASTLFAVTPKGRVGIGVSPSSNSYLTIVSDGNSGIRMYAVTTETGPHVDITGGASGNGAIFDFSLFPTDGSSISLVRFMRGGVVTSGRASVDINKPGTSTVNHSLAGNADSYMCNDNGNLAVGKNTSSSKLDVLLTDAGTSAIVNVATFGHNTSGTPAPNYGAGVQIQAQSSASANRNIGRFRWLWTNATDSSGNLAMKGIASGYYNASGVLTEVDAMTWGVNGSGSPLWSVYGVAPVVQAAAYTQTYSTVTRTVNPASTSAFTGIDNAQIGNVYAQLSDLNTLRADVLQAIQLVNSLIDDSQGVGIAQ